MFCDFGEGQGRPLGALVCWLDSCENHEQARGDGGHSKIRQFALQEREDAREVLHGVDGTEELFNHESTPDLVDGFDEPRLFDKA